MLPMETEGDAGKIRTSTSSASSETIQPDGSKESQESTEGFKLTESGAVEELAAIANEIGAVLGDSSWPQTSSPNGSSNYCPPTVSEEILDSSSEKDVERSAQAQHPEDEEEWDFIIEDSNQSEDHTITGANAHHIRPVDTASNKSDEEREKGSKRILKVQERWAEILTTGGPKGFRMDKENEQSTQPTEVDQDGLDDCESLDDVVEIDINAEKARIRQRIMELQSELDTNKECSTPERIRLLNTKAAEERNLHMMGEDDDPSDASDASQGIFVQSSGEEIDDSDDSMVDPAVEKKKREKKKREEAKKKKRAAEATKRKIEKSILERGFLIGWEQLTMFFEKEQNRQKRNNTRKPGESQFANQQINSTTSKAHDKGKKKKMGPPGGKQSRKGRKPLLSTLSNIFNTSDVIASGNPNCGEESIHFTNWKDKEQALSSYLIGTSLEDPRAAAKDKRSLIKASRYLGFRRCSIAPDGINWTLKGFKSTLANYQVIGAADLKMREQDLNAPFGGLFSDELGLGKTVTMLANCVLNPPSAGSVGPTLLVVPASLIQQWKDEIERHVGGDIAERTLVLRSSAELKPFTIKNSSIVIASYEAVRRSFPACKLIDNGDINEIYEIWKRHYQKSRGLLHSIHFHRLIADEAHQFKNRESQSFFAMRAISAQIRWAITATPAHNSVQEFWPYFSFLEVPFPGYEYGYRAFLEHFNTGKDGKGLDRLQLVLRDIMVRRTHDYQIFGKPILTLPKSEQETINGRMDTFEKIVYEVIRKNFIEDVLKKMKNGDHSRLRRRVLVKILRLRQLTSHFLMVIDELRLIHDQFNLQDLWAEECEIAGVGRDFGYGTIEKFIMLRKTDIEDAEKQQVRQKFRSKKITNKYTNEDLALRFRRALMEKESSRQRREFGKCQKCKKTPTDPHITDCLHVYCSECVNQMGVEAVHNHRESTDCCVCQKAYESCKPFEDHKRLVRECTEVTQNSRMLHEKKPKIHVPPVTNLLLRKELQIPTSSKIEKCMDQIETWMSEDHSCKIIVFSQFLWTIKLISRFCSEAGIPSVEYHGEMPPRMRSDILTHFKDDDVNVMICSLKCGGQGLNLTQASRAILLENWWNTAIEQQAFCRIYRRGQTKETQTRRLVVKETIDEYLEYIQSLKTKQINAAMGDDGGIRISELSIETLLSLLGSFDDIRDCSDILPQAKRRKTSKK